MNEAISYTPVGLQKERTYRLVGKEQAKASIYNHYDGLDRVIAKSLNLKFRQRFEYDLHGWPTKRSVEDISGNTLLSEKLHYNTGATPCFNGNISAKEWSAGRYDYVYDSNNRLTEANFSGDIPGGYGDEFTARYSYDSRGNITDQFSFNKRINYTDISSKVAFEEAKASIDFGPNAEYLGKIVTVFDGFYDESLGSDNTLTGPGAKPANVTVYGPRGADDIGHYIGFTMSSDFEKYGAIDNGMYPVFYDKKSKSGAIKSHYAVNNRGPVNCLGGRNPYPSGYSEYQKDGIFIHRTNMSGTANGMVSVGCLLIDAKQWSRFEKQIGRNNFTLILNRQ